MSSGICLKGSGLCEEFGRVPKVGTCGSVNVAVGDYVAAYALTVIGKRLVDGTRHGQRHWLSKPWCVVLNVGDGPEFVG
jgi:hypothetical protein